jgi:hypothetical protein
MRSFARYIVLLAFGTVAASRLPAAAANSLAAIDQHALRAPRAVERSVATLAAYLTRSADDDRDKVRAIYRWVTDRIAYDVEAFLAKRYGDNRTQTVLKKRRGVCVGYANLVRDLCREAGIEAVVVVGASKGYGFQPGKSIPDVDHAWNAVKVDGRWTLLDATWGAGVIRAKKFVKVFDPYYFLTPPDQFIFTHFPKDRHWQLLRQPISAKEFARQPRVGKELFQMGVSAAAVRQQLKDGDVVKAWQRPGAKVTIRQAPLQGLLRAGSSYRFRIETADYTSFAVFYQGQWIYLQRNGPVFECTVEAAKAGQLILRGKPRDSKDDYYWDILGYVVG